MSDERERQMIKKRSCSTIIHTGLSGGNQVSPNKRKQIVPLSEKLGMKTTDKLGGDDDDDGLANILPKSRVSRNEV